MSKPRVVNVDYSRFDGVQVRTGWASHPWIVIDAAGQFAARRHSHESAVTYAGWIARAAPEPHPPHTRPLTAPGNA